MSAPFEELNLRLAEIGDLSAAASLLAWDQQVMMPPRGAASRAEHLATLKRITHEKFISPEIGRLLEELAPFEEAHDYDSFEASLIRVTRRDWEKARKVPSELRAEMSRAASLALPVWVEARANNDFAAFLPALRENVELRRRYIACFEGDYPEPYDVVLDDFERGMTTAEVRSLFGYLKEHQAPLVKLVAGNDLPEVPAGRSFPLELQKQFELEVVRRFGFDDQAWRIDPTVHPFASGTGRDDIRITTRYFTDNLDGLFATMHETGHGLYEHQVDPSLERTPLGSGTSLGMHESQSRMWENLVGRSLPAWRFFFPKLQQTFPDAFRGYDVERWYREINAVQPSLIRVEADEATYNLHIILRFELEQELIDESFPLESLPEEWNRRMYDLLGVEVPNDTEGVLQDTHWAIGAIGYFATYALGNLISAQLWERIVSDLPDLESDFERGEFTALQEWLRDHVHRYGRMFTPAETLDRAIGTKTIDPEPYVRYLQRKLAGIYGLPALTS
ncbi:MAG TPA: carboxypeptidase M32 [Gaiellaceae bacterium]|jgi:carboxypeptidase Taq|nr:carboxypeptidase M32 [Gaiellaceae bacterium]